MAEKEYLFEKLHEIEVAFSKEFTVEQQEMVFRLCNKISHRELDRLIDGCLSQDHFPRNLYKTFRSEYEFREVKPNKHRCEFTTDGRRCQMAGGIIFEGKNLCSWHYYCKGVSYSYQDFLQWYEFWKNRYSGESECKIYSADSIWNRTRGEEVFLKQG